MPFGLGPQELLIVMVIAVLLFGKRLPEVGRSLGKGLMEFRKGLNEIKSEVDAATSVSSSSSSSASSSPRRYNADDYDEPTAPKFEPPTQEPTEVPPQDTTAQV
jgi:sec-independent protein translocase protein TatA